MRSEQEFGRKEAELARKRAREHRLGLRFFESPQIAAQDSFCLSSTVGAISRSGLDHVQTSVYDNYSHSDSMKTTTHLDHISHCKTSSGTKWLNRWTYRLFIINTRRAPPAMSTNLIAASIYDTYSVGPSTQPICTRCCFTMTYMIQVCSNFQ